MSGSRHNLQAMDEERKEEVIVLRAEASLDPPETAWRIEFLFYIIYYIY